MTKRARIAKRAKAAADAAPKTRAPSQRAVKDVSRAEAIARKLAKVAPEEDPAHVAGAIVILATDTIKRSATTLPEARAYLTGLRDAIDALLVNAFPEKE